MPPAASDPGPGPADREPTLREPTFRDVLRARARIDGRIDRTALITSDALSRALGGPAMIKLEHRQITGSFKLRGATNLVAALDARHRDLGVVASSTGNHGRAVAHACRAIGVAATVCMPASAPRVKREAVEALGARTVLVEAGVDAADRMAERLAAETGATLAPPFDHPLVIAGQGTLGLEIAEQAPDLRTILVPLSGGGLLAGVALALKTVDPSIRVIGVSQARGPGMVASLAADRPVEIEEPPTLADALAGGIGLENRWTFSMVRRLMDDHALVEETEIADAIRWAYDHERQVIEGAAAVGLAAALSGRLGPLEGPVATIFCGGAIDMAKHRRIVGGDWRTEATT